MFTNLSCDTTYELCIHLSSGPGRGLEHGAEPKNSSENCDIIVNFLLGNIKCTFQLDIF